MSQRRFVRGLAGCVAVMVCAGVMTWCAPVLAASVTPQEAALRIDRLLAQELADAEHAPPSSAKPAPVPQADDVTWLRRVYLDLLGELPSPEEITAFALDKSADKRPQQIARLVDDPRYGENWARYWRDVILSRRTDERALLAAGSATQWLAEQFNQGVSWQRIAHDLVTATGELGEDGRTALIASQWGQVPETAAEVSRVLMGVQIQCAQCHDHKTDRWKRTQFHELAAFFPRIVIRPVIEADGKRRGFELLSKDDFAQRQQKKVGKKPNPRFEHYMPDLDDPAAEGTLMQPVFFVTEQKMEIGASDAERRATLADWIVSADNPWFAQALVNRLWAELVGEGFYEAVDDIGPDKDCRAPNTLNLLTSQFIASGYDLKWLLQTIAATEVYGRESRQRAAGAVAFEANCPQPLRADQVFNNLASRLGVEEGSNERLKKAALRPNGSPRSMFVAKFGFDPSDPRDEHTASIDQALMLMNTPALARALSARATRAQTAGTLLSRLLEDKDDDAVIAELYLRLFAREPKPSELATCRDYLLEVGDRDEAFEDILWSLVNSTEFLYRD